MTPEEFYQSQLQFNRDNYKAEKPSKPMPVFETKDGNRIKELEEQLEKSEVFNSESLERFDLLLRIKKLVRRGYVVLGDPIHQELERLTDTKTK